MNVYNELFNTWNEIYPRQNNIYVTEKVSFCDLPCDLTSGRIGYYVTTRHQMKDREYYLFTGTP